MAGSLPFAELMTPLPVTELANTSTTTVFKDSSGGGFAETSIQLDDRKEGLVTIGTAKATVSLAPLL